MERGGPPGGSPEVLCTPALCTYHALVVPKCPYVSEPTSAPEVTTTYTQRPPANRLLSLEHPPLFCRRAQAPSEAPWGPRRTYVRVPAMLAFVNAALRSLEVKAQVTERFPAGGDLGGLQMLPLQERAPCTSPCL